MNFVFTMWNEWSEQWWMNPRCQSSAFFDTGRWQSVSTAISERRFGHTSRECQVVFDSGTGGPDPETTFLTYSTPIGENWRATYNYMVSLVKKDWKTVHFTFLLSPGLPRRLWSSMDSVASFWNFRLWISHLTLTGTSWNVTFVLLL